MRIESISALDAIDIRHRILWPDKPKEHSVVEGDDLAQHLGVFNGQTLVGVASLFEDEGTVRLRKFAVDTQFQGKGFGSALLKHAIDTVQRMGVSLFWCDARENAIGIYEHHGMTVEGERFYKSDIPYFRMSLSF